jgi:hypothetical protein
VLGREIEEGQQLVRVIGDLRGGLGVLGPIGGGEVLPAPPPGAAEICAGAGLPVPWSVMYISPPSLPGIWRAGTVTVVETNRNDRPWAA